MARPDPPSCPCSGRTCSACAPKCRSNSCVKTSIESIPLACSDCFHHTRPSAARPNPRLRGDALEIFPRLAPTGPSDKHEKPDRSRPGIPHPEVAMTLLLLQIAVVMLVTLACGCIARRIGQSRVIGEIIGGIVLGPS